MRKVDNVYDLLNAELERLHKRVEDCANCGGKSAEANAQAYFNRLCLIQDGVIKALEKQPLHADTLKDIQDTLTDTILLGDPTDSNNNGGNDG